MIVVTVPYYRGNIWLLLVILNLLGKMALSIDVQTYYIYDITSYLGQPGLWL
jgi:hypothetical protein